MPIPEASRASVAAEKVRDYLLNADHPEGGAKARWFQSLGYGRDQWQDLAADLLAVARNCSDFATASTPFGIKYIVRGKIGQREQSSCNVLTVWIVEADEPPRLVTAYPDDQS